MKILVIALVWMLISVCLFCLYFYIQGRNSQKGHAIGIVDGKLAKCSNSPNCVCTEFSSDEIHYLPSLSAVAQKPSFVLGRATEIIEAMGGKIVTSNEDYLAATFSSKVFTFVDDFELRFDNKTQNLHVRSAARVGWHDQFVNKKRVQTFTDTWNK